MDGYGKTVIGDKSDKKETRIMKKFNLILTSILVVGIVLLSTNFIYAQQRDNTGRRQNQDRPQFDPKQMMERRMQQIMERLKLNEEETAVIKPQIEALTNMRMEQGTETRELMDALQKAVDAKDEKQTGTALAAVKAKREEQKAKYEKAEKGLIELLSVEQEANLTIMGVVNSDGMGMGMGFRMGGPGGAPGQPGGNRPQRQDNQGGN